MEHDDFYVLRNPRQGIVKEILAWASKNGLKTDVDMLEAYKSFRRTKADKEFGDVLNMINKDSVEYFRIILRKQENLFGILTDKMEIKDILQIGIRGIDVGSKEYFISVYLDKEKLKILKEKYDLEKL
ncbi:MAG: hypothetical protein DRN71_05455 [Candidatus Nanohalarchaeota archaeon]|nr:MAG: hypothetical protein DRN71_05455 [Candidatus Nanohaloarchaeota archaeon]